MRPVRGRRHDHGADRHRGKREKALHALAILSPESVAGHVFEREESSRALVELLEDPSAAGLPVLALEDYKKIVASHVADEVHQRIGLLLQRLGRQANHLVASPVSVLVVERLEVIQVGIAGDKWRARIEQAIQMLTDGYVAG